MKEVIEQAVAEVVRAAHVLTTPEAQHFLSAAAELISHCYRNEGKVLVAGNGGSLCDAMHFAEELTGQFRSFRPALAALALSDPSHLTCVANDMGYESVFSRYVEALGKEGDVLVLLTTSGNSQNLRHAARVARQKGMITIALLGKGGGQLRGECSLEWIVEGFLFSDRIQEAHMAALHILVELIECHLFYPQKMTVLSS